MEFSIPGKTRIAELSACRLTGCRHYPASWVEAMSRWDQWFMGRPLQWVLRRVALLYREPGLGFGSRGYIAIAGSEGKGGNRGVTSQDVAPRPLFWVHLASRERQRPEENRNKT